MTRGSQFRPKPPPALTSADYTQAFHEIKAVGGNGTTTPARRTAEQTEIALFWAGGAGTSTPAGHWNQIAATVARAAGNTLAQNARLFALLNVTMADSAIASFDAKYASNFWRPVTAIRAAETDGNRRTAQSHPVRDLTGQVVGELPADEPGLPVVGVDVADHRRVVHQVEQEVAVGGGGN